MIISIRRLRTTDLRAENAPTGDRYLPYGGGGGGGGAVGNMSRRRGWATRAGQPAFLYGISI